MSSDSTDTSGMVVGQVTSLEEWLAHKGLDNLEREMGRLQRQVEELRELLVELGYSVTGRHLDSRRMSSIGPSGLDTQQVKQRVEEEK